MASRMYRETEATLTKSIAGGGTRCFTISPIDADQVPAGYVKSVKVSVNPIDFDTDKASLVVASCSSNPGDVDDWITAQATGQGDGTVWLSLKRAIKSSVAEPDRNDGEVYIHVFGSAGVRECTVVCETWGRFLNTAAN